MIYRNVKTGVEVEVFSEVSGDGWELIAPTAAQEEKPKAPKKKTKKE